MDVGEVLSFANGFAHAVVIDDQDLIASYLRADLEANLNGHLDRISELDGAEVESITAVGDQFDSKSAEQCVSVTRFWGGHEEIRMRGEWVQEPHQLLLRTLQIVERKPQG